MKRLFTSLDPEAIQQLVERAMRRDGSYTPPNFLTYFLVEHPADINREELASAFMAIQSVEQPRTLIRPEVTRKIDAFR